MDSLGVGVEKKVSAEHEKTFTRFSSRAHFRRRPRLKTAELSS
jgi:hypothetical protein